MYGVGKKQDCIRHLGSSRRLTDRDRRQIVRERANGVSVSAISAALKVSPKTVYYNVLGRGQSAISATNQLCTQRNRGVEPKSRPWHT